jgi:U3 small nucleolar RNA-associated protein 5
METRIAHHSQLLALNGRLDLVVSQIDLTSDVVPTQRLPAPKVQKVSKAPAARKYVEGETSSSESDQSEGEAGTSQQPIPVPAEQNDEVEDLVMQEDGLLDGTESGSGDENSDEEDDMPALRKSQVAKLNGFLELEAEETDEEGSDEDLGASKEKKAKPAFSLVNGDLGEDEDEDEGEDLDRYESDFINDDESEEESNGDSD